MGGAVLKCYGVWYYRGNNSFPSVRRRLTYVANGTPPDGAPPQNCVPPYSTDTMREPYFMVFVMYRNGTGAKVKC